MTTSKPRLVLTARGRVVLGLLQAAGVGLALALVVLCLAHAIVSIAT